MSTNILDHVSLEDTLAIQKISNHPVMVDVERYVILIGLNITAGPSKYMTMQYEIVHISNNIRLNIYPINKPEWIISNDIRVLLRDENGHPILNPDYEPIIDDTQDPNGPELIINIEDEYLSEPAFDYFKNIAWDSVSPLSKRQHFEFYIQLLDIEDNFFNFY